MINVPEQAEMAVDFACRTALSRRGVSHLTIPIDIQERKLKGDYSRHKVAGHTSDIYNSSPHTRQKIDRKSGKYFKFRRKGGNTCGTRSS
jgi:pyruvate dehydrogenase (quinone)